MRDHRCKLDSSLPPIFCVVGYKDSGKTGVAVGLVRELRSRGYRVAAVKHGHGFRLDVPGTDSWRLQNEGGATPVVLTGPEGYAVMGNWASGAELGLAAVVRRYLPDVGVVVAEGFKEEAFPKIGVHRSGSGPERIYQPSRSGADSFLALVTDDADPRAPIPQLSPDDPSTPARLADLLEACEVLRP